MAILETDINYRLSGGIGNTNPNLSLGGIMSTVEGGIVISDSDNNDMDNITSSEAANGIVIYHGYFWSNEIVSAPLTFHDPVFWIESQTSSGNTDVSIAIADEAKNAPIQVLANEETAPSGPSFTTPGNKAAGIAIGSLDQNDFRGTWIRYEVDSSTSAEADQYTIKAEGDTDS